MRVVEVAGALGGLKASLADEGFVVREVEDVTTVPGLIERIGKPYLTPLSSPSHNDFTAGNSLWLVAEKEGEPVYLGCARLEDLGGEAIGRYWARVLHRAYAERPEDVVINGVRPEIERTVGGRLVYFGDLYANVSVRGARKALRAFVAIGHLAVSLKWDPDWVYCFVREADVLRGAAAIYGFTALYPNPFNWVAPPPPRENSEWLAALPRTELWHCAKAALEASERSVTRRLGAVSNNQQGKVQNSGQSLVVTDG